MPLRGTPGLILRTAPTRQQVRMLLVPVKQIKRHDKEHYARDDEDAPVAEIADHTAQGRADNIADGGQ